MRHPLHPILAHFPVACWSLATIADVVSPRYGQPAWHLAGMLLLIGVLVGIPTIFIGIFDLIQIPKEPAPVRAAFMHMGIMMVAFLLYLGSLLLHVHEGNIIAPGIATLTFSLLGFVFLLVGGWLGGTLVYGYGAGGDREEGEASV